MVVPAKRQETVWREILRRAKVPVSSQGATAGRVRSVAIDIERRLALTSWETLLDAIELELKDEQQAKNDLRQLRGLCDAADSKAFLPISSAEVTDQRTPAFILQLSEVMPKALKLAEIEGVLSIGNLKKSQSWDRLGQYVEFNAAGVVGSWCGINFDLWRKYGGSPIWLMFHSTKWGRALEVRGVLEPWAAAEGKFSEMDDDYFLIRIDLVIGEEMDEVVRSIVNHFVEIKNQLSKLPAKSSVTE
jgi:hypothetical protein